MSLQTSPGTIDDVVDRLDAIVDAAHADASRLGYFAALYRRVTDGVRQGIARGEFDDGVRMEAFDVRFACRYLEAYDAYLGGRPATDSWRVAFDAMRDPAPIVLQHLALGMNAHINLDLGIAVAETMRGALLADLRADFDRIGDLIGTMVDDVQRDLSTVWPLLRPLDWLGGRAEERFAGFSIRVARDHAWRFAERLAREDAAERDRSIAALDAWIAAFGRELHRPSRPLRFAQWWIRRGERGSVPEIVETLRRPRVAP